MYIIILAIESEVWTLPHDLLFLLFKFITGGSFSDYLLLNDKDLRCTPIHW